MVLGGEPVVDDPAAAPLAPSLRPSAELSDSARPANDVPRVRVRGEKLLQRRVAVVVQVRWQMPRELRCLDEQHPPNYTHFT